MAKSSQSSPKPPKLTTAQKADLVAARDRILTRAKRAYEKADKLLGELLPNVKAGEVISTKAGEFEVVDNFAKNNTAFRIARVSRFELKPVKAAKAKPEK